MLSLKFEGNNDVALKSESEYFNSPIAVTSKWPMSSLRLLCGK